MAAGSKLEADCSRPIVWAQLHQSSRLTFQEDQRAIMFSCSVAILARSGRRRFFSSQSSSLLSILEQVQNGKLQPSEAQSLLIANAADLSPEDAIEAFANLDHTRSSRTGFPEAVFAAGKTPEQVARILDDMSRHLNEEIAKGAVMDSQRAILATR
jgi:hypothetical protein